MTGRGVARAGVPVTRLDGSQAGRRGWVTSGTMVPYWNMEGDKLASHPGAGHELRSICLALLDSDLRDDDEVQIDIRGHLTPAVIVPYHLRGDAPPYARPIVYHPPEDEAPLPPLDAHSEVGALLRRAVENHRWRQEECINLIPSEMTPSPLVRLLSITDPAFRYAEHRELEAFDEADIFYYQGTGFIDEVEQALEREMRRFLGAAEVETRVVSGQMANAALFSALVDYRNRWNRKGEPQRLRMVMNNHIGKGGHLSAQPMGALKDYVAVDPHTDKPAVVNFPVLPATNTASTWPAPSSSSSGIARSSSSSARAWCSTRNRWPTSAASWTRRGWTPSSCTTWRTSSDSSGPHFQQPFAEGADFVTGSTHKTFFGTQRGVIAGRFRERDDDYELWRTVRRRTFPGSVSNHHLGTMLGLLAAAYEMNHFKDAYQPAVIANAKAFARALAAAGLKVAGDPAIGHTETHQVIVEVGYGQGPLLAERLEANDIICNYQAAPDEEGFTAAGALRLGVAEMTRFGMGPEDFAALAGIMAGIILEDREAKAEVRDLRQGFRGLRYCFGETDFPEALKALRETV